MKRRLKSAAWILPLLTLACGGGDLGEHDAGEHSPMGPPDPLSAPEAERAEALGAPIAQELAQTLVGRLTQAIDEEGLEGAVEFCALEAIPLTQAVQEAQGVTALEIKRSSMGWRNPQNAPDPWEERVLAYLMNLEADPMGEAPEFITASGPDGSLRYYRTLRTAPFCLSCHGTEASMDPALVERIRALYPDDRGTGYEAGSFRGVIRVQIPAGSP
jgi:hypothetical protein